jgi:hypothetical protein
MQDAARRDALAADWDSDDTLKSAETGTHPRFRPSDASHCLLQVPCSAGRCAASLPTACQTARPKHGRATPCMPPPPPHTQHPSVLRSAPPLHPPSPPPPLGPQLSLCRPRPLLGSGVLGRAISTRRRRRCCRHQEPLARRSQPCFPPCFSISTLLLLTFSRANQPALARPRPPSSRQATKAPLLSGDILLFNSSRVLSLFFIRFCFRFKDTFLWRRKVISAAEGAGGGLKPAPAPGAAEPPLLVLQVGVKASVFVAPEAALFRRDCVYIAGPPPPPPPPSFISPPLPPPFQSLQPSSSSCCPLLLPPTRAWRSK